MAGVGEVSGEYRIYSDLAGWWPFISPLREYTQEAAYLAAVIDATSTRVAAGRRDEPGEPEEAEVPEVLDLGSGGGHIAVHLRDRFRLTLVDISEEMLAVSRQLNPDCVHRVGDMRTVRLQHEFDVVLVHDAIDYIIGAENLRQVIETAAVHCRPGGIAIFVPDYTKDSFAELTGGGGGGVDQAGRTASFSERTWDPDPGDDWVQADYEFTFRAADGTQSVVHESHQLSAFSRDTWLDLLAKAGFDLEPGLDEQRISSGQRPGNLFVVRKPAG
jgi:SAM-dependent methyltransferase